MPTRCRRIDQSDWKERYFKKTPIPTFIRNKIIMRDKGICQYCGKSGVIENDGIKLKVYEYTFEDYRIPFEIDHIIPEYVNNDIREDNLVLSCRKCNRSKGSRTPNMAGMEVYTHGS